MRDYQTNLECSGTQRRIPGAAEHLKAFEATVIAATAGYPPPEEQWGALSAPDFLNVVYDVTTWSLTNFESFRAPCLATVYYQDWAPYLRSHFLFAAANLRVWTSEQPHAAVHWFIGFSDNKSTPFRRWCRSVSPPVRYARGDAVSALAYRRASAQLSSIAALEASRVLDEPERDGGAVSQLVIVGSRLKGSADGAYRLP